MEQETSLLSLIRKFVLYVLVFLFPLFFLPFTQEFFTTSKLYLLFFGSLLLLTLSTLEFLLTKKFVWKRDGFDGAMILLVVTAGLSVVLSSPNKVQGLLSPVFGVAALFSLLILYFFLSREKNESLKTKLVYVPSVLLALVSIFYFFDPLKHAQLSPSLQFLKNPFFTPLGGQLDALYFLGFAAVLSVSQIFSKNARGGQKNKTLSLITLFVTLTAVGLILFSLVKTKDSFVLPPLSLSWYGAVETLKNPVTALFGVGIDNYSAMFTRVKDAAYNASPLWQIASFNVSRSTFLHVLTEMGLFGAAAFTLLLLQIVRKALAAKKAHANNISLLPAVYVLALILFFPPSLTLLFIVFLMVAGVGSHEKHEGTDTAFVFDTSKILPLYAVMLVLGFLFIASCAYFAGRAYAAELYFKQSLDAYAKSNIKGVYDNMRKAVATNPFIERYRTNFSQVNLLIANNVASKLNVQPKEGEKAPELTDEEKQTIAQALQAAIEEAKAVVSLNPQTAANWDGLAGIYRNIINVAQGADTWTVSAYQRAIVLDPQNPIYRISLGGVMFSFKNYDDAFKLFEQAVSIKPDLPNAHYNLAWAAYQKQDYKTAALAMQNAVSLIDPKKEKTDYDRALAELAEFKKKLPEEESATKAAESQPSKLGVPTPPVQTPLEPQIKLPKDASPEAK